ncbi:MAG: SCP2 sterol-binding domain-containing protein, partial [Granulosicoccaceae bacterium]
MQVPFPATLAANAALSALIRSNPEARQLLSKSRGGLIALELQNPSLSLRVSLQADGIELLSVYEEEPDLQLTADIPALKALADAGHDPILDGRVQADGDMALASFLQQLLVVLTADWESQLAPFVGDTLAHKIGTLARGLAAW